MFSLIRCSEILSDRNNKRVRSRWEVRSGSASVCLGPPVDEGLDTPYDLESRGANPVATASGTDLTLVKAPYHCVIALIDMFGRFRYFAFAKV